MVETNIKIEVQWGPQETPGSRWYRILASGPGLTLGEKYATIIDDGENVFCGLLPIQTTDVEGVFECTFDHWRESEVWKLLKQK